MEESLFARNLQKKLSTGNVHDCLYWRLFYIEREPGSGSIQFSANGCIAPTHLCT